MLRTNNRCVALINIGVEVTKYGKFSQIHPVHTLFVHYKKLLVLPEKSIHGKFSTHKDIFLCYEQTTDVLRHSTSV